jgi:hypothetical protein
MKPSTAARLAGAFFLAAIACYGTGNALVQNVLTAPEALALIASDQGQLIFGAALMLANSAIVIGIGVALFSILERHSKAIAVAYLSARLIEAILLGVGVASLLSLVRTPEHFEAARAGAIENNALAYQGAMIALGLGSVVFCGLLYRTRLLPRGLAAWGVLGYAVFLTGAVLELLGFAGIGVLLSIPGGLFELTVGAWLIVKGFDPGQNRAPAAAPRAYGVTVVTSLNLPYFTYSTTADFTASPRSLIERCLRRCREWFQTSPGTG